jgi:hypothetical protein
MRGIWTVAACLWLTEIAALGAPGDDVHPVPGLGEGRGGGLGGPNVEKDPLRLSDGERHFFKQNPDASWIAPVQPADPMDDLERRVAPLVEAATGMTLLVLPPIVAQPRASVIRKLAAYHHTTPEALLQDDVIAHAIALYVPMDGRIYVMVDEDLGTREARRWDTATRPDMPCVLAHELTHALQHQHGWTVGGEDDPDRSERLLTVSEGQASWVEGRVCGWSDQADSVLGPGWPRRDRPVPDDSIAGVRYGHGLRFVEAVAAAWDAKTIWSFVAAPPTLDQIRQVSTLGLAAPWVDGEVLTDAAVALGAHSGDVQTVTATTSAVMSAMGLDPLHTPSRAISHQATWFSFSREHWLVWMLMPSPEAAENVLQQVRWSTDNLTSTLYSARHRELIGSDHELLLGLTVASSRRRTKGLAVDEVLTVTYNTTGADRYETWVRRGDLILQVTDTRDPTDPRVVDAALKSLLARPAPAQRVDVPADPNQVRALLSAPAPVSPETVSLAWFSGVALPLSLSLHDSTCERFLQPALDSAPASQRQRALGVAHACAVLSDDLPLAGSLRSSLAVDEMIPFARGEHAYLLASAGRWAEADALLRGWSPDQSEMTPSLLQLRISVAVALRRWSEVAILGADPTLDPAVMAKVGLALIGAGRGKEGRPILELACRILPDDEREGLCW